MPKAEAAAPPPHYQESTGQEPTGQEPTGQEPTGPEPPPLAALSADDPPPPAISEPSIDRDRSRRTFRRPPAEAPPPADPGAERQRAAPASVWLAWAGTIVVIAILLGGGYTFRADVMHAWPASERLYAALGLGPAPAPASP
ncbi:MAG: hypothetical protein ACREFS_06820 [Acetobacteraceae bacterium]